MESEHSQVLPGLAQMRQGLSRGCTSLSLNYFSNSAGTSAVPHAFFTSLEQD